MFSQRTRRQLGAALGIVLLARIFVFIVVVLAIQITGRDLGDIQSFATIWDANIYLDIAQHGYNVTGPHQNFGFWPLWPMVLQVGLMIFRDPFWTVQIMTTLILTGTVMIMYRVFRLDQSAHRSRRAIIALFAFPTAFFLATGYTESLYLLLSVSAFYFARKKRWLHAGVIGALLATTRHVGLIIAVPLAIEAIHQIRAGIITWRKASAVLSLVVIGSLAFPLSMSMYFHRPFAPVEYQRIKFDHALSNPVTEILTYLRQGITEPRYAISLVIFLLVTVTIIAAIREYRRKTMRLSYLVYALLLYLFPLLTTNNLIGVARYSLVIFPLMLVFAISGRRFWAIIWPMLIVQAILLVTWSAGMVLVL